MAWGEKASLICPTVWKAQLKHVRRSLISLQEALFMFRNLHLVWHSFPGTYLCWLRPAECNPDHPEAQGRNTILPLRPSEYSKVTTADASV